MTIAMLTRDQILAAQDRKMKVMKVQEWGGEVIVMTMDGEGRDAFESSLMSNGKRDLKNFRAKLLAFCLVDEQGNRLFTESDINALGKKNAGVLDRLVNAATELNKMSEADVEELAKN